MREFIASLVFWFCLAGLFYTYIGYPLHVMLWARLFARPVRRGAFGGKVSVVISVFNDSARLVIKLKELLKVRGAEKIIEILVGSDGSSDGAAGIEKVVGDPRIRVTEFVRRRGKASVLNDLLPRTEGDVVVLMDARQILAENALENLLAPFADEAVGVVSGHLVFRQSATDGAATKGVGSYWSYEKTIRRAEAAFASVPGATGALYAIRRKLVRPIPAATILDDVAVPMLAVERGARCIFADDAVCFDEPSASVGSEQIRKRRTAAGNIQLALLFPRWLVPGRNPIWWQFVSHKMLRLASPFFMAGLVAAAALMPVSIVGAVTQIGSGCGVLLALAGWLGVKSRLTAAAFVFGALNVTILGAWWDALRGKFAAAWQKS